MKFWQLSTQVLSVLLAAVTVSAGGPANGEATADPNSAVVKLTANEYKEFIESNPYVLAEFFAPWCGYCKMLGPEFSKAADKLNESQPDIKLAQVDCTEEEELCTENGIRGYPTLKVFSGSPEKIEDYSGPRNADGIVDYMIKQSMPPVSVPESASAFEKALDSQTEPFIVQVLPAEYDGAKDKLKQNETFSDIAASERKTLNFFSISEQDQVDVLKSKFPNANLKKISSPKYFIAHPGAFADAAELSGKFTEESLQEFIKTEVIPYFGDINRDTYMLYMSSPLPLAYYFYNSNEQRKEVESLFNKLGKKHRGKINFVGLDANMFGRHAESLNMDPSVVPLFVIQNTKVNKKYGIDQKAHPSGPSGKAIESHVNDFLKDKLEPTIKSEPLPTDEEKASQSVLKLVAHNHENVLKDTSKDVFVKYYAPWCGHCKRLAPIWEELGEIFESNKSDANVVVAKVDHTLNDVTTPFDIAGYPTLLLYPANGEIDEATGLRKPVVYELSRDLDSLIDFVKEKGGLKVDGHDLRKKLDEKKPSEDKKEEAKEKENHDEL
ncbi:Piso0_005124 [Millerozyma farinosa CBS 7064]|uniref:protein disulfide-isomerase n=1 Tax=Pichia sorbitophila (strain ATCC MYA-4447 / BCRC 22081 / CBS 7064 / NBRC 10061 / NRRL Y-12695) TaxID=559304 RepID=G8Y4A5_PICSO|nr:Piso0_005124 [Millerozyma farinosa CBS 7064]